MNNKIISKDTIAQMGLVVLLSIFGGWSAGTQRQTETIKRIAVVEEKCGTTQQKYDQIIKRLDELSTGQQTIIIDMATVKSDVKLLNATKADRKYTD